MLGPRERINVRRSPKCRFLMAEACSPETVREVKFKVSQLDLPSPGAPNGLISLSTAPLDPHPTL